MTVSALAAAVRGTILCDYSPNNGFSSVATDSRNVLPGSLFVPLMGEFLDGHTFIAKALESGAAVIFVDAAHGSGSASLFCTLGKQYNASFIVVENTLHALQDAAGAYLKKFPKLLKIGITGSSGKTTTKEITGAIFSQKYRVIMNEGNLNSETGLPLSVFKVRPEHEVGIFELGMNRKGEITEIARVLMPKLALITNIGTAHIGILGSRQAIAEEKKEIFSFFDSDSTGFVPEDDDWKDFLSDVRSG
ncbi:MAG TPA: Mur ligase family protein, partial [Treponemataceae bacterium]|nr:Mur ligase family protein [Treponemataceae bacterium]